MSMNQQYYNNILQLLIQHAQNDQAVVNLITNIYNNPQLSSYVSSELDKHLVFFNQHQITQANGLDQAMVMMAAVILNTLLQSNNQPTPYSILDLAQKGTRMLNDLQRVQQRASISTNTFLGSTAQPTPMVNMNTTIQQPPMASTTVITDPQASESSLRPQRGPIDPLMACANTNVAGTPDIGLPGAVRGSQSTIEDEVVTEVEKVELLRFRRDITVFEQDTTHAVVAGEDNKSSDPIEAVCELIMDEESDRIMAFSIEYETAIPYIDGRDELLKPLIKAVDNFRKIGGKESFIKALKTIEVFTNNDVGGLANYLMSIVFERINLFLKYNMSSNQAIGSIEDDIKGLMTFLEAMDKKLDSKYSIVKNFMMDIMLEIYRIMKADKDKESNKYFYKSKIYALYLPYAVLAYKESIWVNDETVTEDVLYTILMSFYRKYNRGPNGMEIKNHFFIIDRDFGLFEAWIHPELHKLEGIPSEVEGPMRKYISFTQRSSLR